MDTSKVILNPASIEGYNERVFCIGPYGNKVGFGSQQKRALNLIWALANQGIIKRGTKVAVIGGGLAGIMACSALKGHGCFVTLYEEKEDVLLRQFDAAHRLVHPYINAWPMIDTLQSTTAYPFYDWFVGRCSKVIERLKSDWNEMRSDCLVEFVNFARIKKVMKPRPQDNCITFTYENVDPQVQVPGRRKPKFTKTSDVVIVATGFGEERIFSSAHAKSYWNRDIINEVRRDKVKYKDIIVSGTGDGGLIDFARLTHNEFDDGKLTVKLIGMLRHPGHGPAIGLIEADGKDTKAPISAIEEKIRDIEIEAIRLSAGLAPENEDQVSNYLAEEYADVVANLSEDVKNMLFDSLEDPERVKLYGRTSTPFSLEASPINKLIIAHVLAHFPEIYKRGVLIEERKRLYELFGNGDKKRLKPDYYVCRHGADAPVTKIIEGFDADAFRGKQKEIADVLNLKAYEDYSCFVTYLKNPREHDKSKREFARAREELVRLYAKKYFEQQPQKVSGPISGNSAYGFIDNSDYRNSYVHTGGFDKELFGVEVVLLEDEVAESATGPGVFP